MERSVVTRLDGYQANKRAAKVYPYVLVHGTGDALSLTVSALREGTLPVVIDYKGKLIKVKDVKHSVLELSKLLSVFTFDIVISATESKLITTNLELLEAGIWT